MDVATKREREKEVVSLMISLYCRKKHGGKTFCPECAALDDYARSRSDHCPFMETKTFCSNCRVHCYQKNMREKIREVMRFSGPRRDITALISGGIRFQPSTASSCQTERRNIRSIF